MGKKNLDQLFQEKLSDFSEVPDEKVWQSIEASLDKKKKSRRVIPLWWKLGGAAAVLAFVMYLVDPFENKAVSPTVTDIETTDTKTDVAPKPHGIEKDLKNSNTGITDVEVSESSKAADLNPTEDMVIPENEIPSDDFKATSTSEDVRIAQGSSTTSQEEGTRNTNQNPSLTSDSTANHEEAVARTDVENNDSEDSIYEGLGQNPMERGFGEVEKTNKVQIAENESVSEEVVKDQKKKSIFDEIAEQEQEEEVVGANKGGKWSAGPSVAPVYFDALGQGSPVHSIFVPNSKSGDLNLSYGLSVAYEINDKLKIRSGVHRVDFGYSTDDVEFSSSLESSAVGQITNVNYSATGKNIVVASSATDASSGVVENFVPLAQDFAGQGASQNGAMSQQFGYLEVPLELEYTLLDRKFGVNLIGGFSSLFLVDNSISLSAGELTTQMGEANNVNNINFSTNVGIGVNYNFSPKVQLNVEPVFKYQLNTFSRTEGTFQPFTVGVYSGVSFKF